MPEDTWSIRDASAFLGVSQATVKRWADARLLECERTAGGHRRFERTALERFRLAQRGDTDGDDPVEAWFEAILGRRPCSLEARLLERRHALGDFAHVADEIGAALTRIGERWSEGLVSLAEEHAGSDRLRRALHRLFALSPVAERAPAALLVTAEDDEHTLGLSLCELCLRELGYDATFLGAPTPLWAVEEALTQRPYALLCVSASASSTSRTLRKYLAKVERIADATGARVVLGGAGPWPSPRPETLRVTSFVDLGKRCGAAHRASRAAR